jgi:hypothetical protein
MADRLDHEDAMKLAVQLACSYLGTSHSGTTDAEDLILNYYRQSSPTRASRKRTCERRRDRGPLDRMNSPRGSRPTRRHADGS